MPKPTRLPLELRQIDPARGRARRYHLAESQSLFGDLAIFISWGRIGKPPRVRLETFANEAARSTRWDELLARRNAHGYVLHPSSRTRAGAIATPPRTTAAPARAGSAAARR